MTLTIKTTLKDLLNSRFIIIYRFSPSLHKKRAVLPDGTALLLALAAGSRFPCRKSGVSDEIGVYFGRIQSAKSQSIIRIV